MSVANRVRGWALTTLIVLLTLIIGWVVILYATGRTVTERDVLVEIRTQSCIITVDFPHRSPDQAARCRELAEASVP